MVERRELSSNRHRQLEEPRCGDCTSQSWARGLVMAEAALPNAEDGRGGRGPGHREKADGLMGSMQRSNAALQHCKYYR